jgi:hypothetical protein
LERKKENLLMWDGQMKERVVGGIFFFDLNRKIS